MLQSIQFFGLTIRMYRFWNTISGIIMTCYILCHSKAYVAICPTALRQKDKLRRILVGGGEIVTLIVIITLLVTALNKEFGDWFTHGNANYYGTLTAWVVSIVIVTKIYKVPALKVLDFLTPGLPLSLFFSKLGCFCYGCCSGFEMGESWYFNHSTGLYEFPVQIVEAIVALAIFFVIRYYEKHNKFSGSVFPLFLLLYSVSRFLTEFLRADFPNVVGPLDAYQVLSIPFLLLGGLFLYIVWAYRSEIEKRQTPKICHKLSAKKNC